MAAKMTLRERVTAALRGEMPDMIPFTCYEEMMPQGRDRSRLHELGVAVFSRIYPFRIRRDRVRVETRDIRDERYAGNLTVYETPVGTLTQKQIVEPGYGSLWTTEHLIKKPEDYAIFEFILRDETCEPDVDGFLKHDASFGDLGLAVPRAADPPMQELWRRYSGLERFSLDWFDCRDEVMRVLKAFDERNERIWRIVADTPSEFCSSGGNLSGDMVGPPMFRQLILPHFEREARIIHAAGKRTMNHMDGMLKSLVEVVGTCPIDIVEAFNPVPDGNVSVADVRRAWPGKTLSINFPSSVHLRPKESIREIAIQILREAAPGKAFVMGITEDVPLNVIVESMTTIATTLNEYGRCPIEPGSLPG